MTTKQKHTVPGVKQQRLLVSILQRFMTNEAIQELVHKYNSAQKNSISGAKKLTWEPTKEEIRYWRSWVEGSAGEKEICAALKISGGTMHRRFGLISKMYLTDSLAKYE